MPWYTDYGLIRTGMNKQVPQKQPIEEMNTLRFFPNGTEPNCYTIFFTSYISGYIVRAGFYYGNYDGLSRPPTFDLTSNGKNWTTVNTTSSMGGVRYTMKPSMCLMNFKIMFAWCKPGKARCPSFLHWSSCQ